MNKKKVLFDKAKIKDNSSIKTPRKGGFVTAIDHESGECIFEKLPNKITVAGSDFTVAKLWDLKPESWTPTYNTYLGLDNSVSEGYSSGSIRPDEKIYLFCVGIDGCGSEASQVYNVDPTKWIDKDSIIPFRYQNISNDLNDELREKYFGKKTVGDKVAYYFKEFDSAPEFKRQYTDGTPLTNDIYNISRLEEVETYVEMKMSISKEDTRDFFISTIGIKQARINSLSLCTAWKKVINGYVYYQDIRPYSKYNFSNEPLIEESKGIDFIYQIYY